MAQCASVDLCVTERTTAVRAVFFVAEDDVGTDLGAVGSWTPAWIVTGDCDPSTVTLTEPDLTSPSDAYDQAAVDSGVFVVGTDKVWRVTATWAPADTDGDGGAVKPFEVSIDDGTDEHLKVIGSLRIEARVAD